MHFKIIIIVNNWLIGFIIVVFLTLIQSINCDTIYENDDKLTRNSVFFCNFDGNNTCGGTLFFNSSGILHSFSFQQNQIIINTTVTDVTSISKRCILNNKRFYAKFLKNLLCKIFKQSQLEHQLQDRSMNLHVKYLGSN